MRFTSAILTAFVCIVIGLSAQDGREGMGTRPLSRQECLELALLNNTTLEVARYGPRDARLSLDESYGVYDPVLGAEATQRFNSQTAREFDSTTGVPGTPGSETTVNSFGPTLGGVLPSGLRYDAFAGLDHISGRFGDRPTDQFRTDVGIQLSQPLLRNSWIDGSRVVIKQAKMEYTISRHQLELDIMDTVRLVEIAYYDLVEAIDTVKARETALSLAQKLLDDTKTKVEVGTLPPLDQALAASQVASATADLIDAKANLVFRQNGLKNLITDNYESWYNTSIVPLDEAVPLPESYDFIESAVTAVGQRPDYRMAVLELERQGIVVTYRRNQLFPVLDLVGSYGRTGFDEANFPGQSGRFSETIRQLRDEDSPRYSFGLRFSVPLFSQTERSQYRLARSQEEQLGLLLRDRHSQLLVDLANGIENAKASYERVGARRQARQYREQALDAEQKRLEQGTSTSFLVLEAQNALTDARATEIQSKATYQKALTEFYYREGTLLERRMITVDVAEE